jgi:hypothetical protein
MMANSVIPHLLIPTYNLPNNFMRYYRPFNKGTPLLASHTE